jgi:hypothetical protein
VSEPAPKDNKEIAGKERLETIPWDAMHEVVRACEGGSDKYGRHNYRNAGGLVAYWEAGMRHMLAWIEGEDRAPDTNVHHLAHATACMLMMLSNIRSGLVPDDRMPPRPPPG